MLGNTVTILYVYIALIISLLVVIVEVVYRLIKEHSLYMSSGFYNTTKYSFMSVLFSSRKARQYATYCTLEKVCINGHLLCNVVVPTKNGKDEIIDLIMIDKYGISIFILEEQRGIISGKENDFFWRIKKGLFSKKTINLAREAKRKIEALQYYLKITDSSILTAYILFDNKTKYNSVRINSSQIKLVRSLYMKGVITYELNNSRRALLDSEIKAYTILLEKKTKISRVDVHNHIVSLSDDDSRKFRFEFRPVVGSYLDLKQIWYILCQCDKDYNPPLSWYRQDIDDYGDVDRLKLVPNVFYKHIINHPFILIRHGMNVVGFLSFEPNKIIEPLKELGRVNYVNAVCIDKTYRRENLKDDLYEFLETKLPKEYMASGILTKITDIQHTENFVLNKRKYIREAILMSKVDNRMFEQNDYSLKGVTRDEITTVYYYKSMKKD